jgi:adenosylmethionine-8-amino-7-oxononanoate aminotransferase
VAAVNCLGAIGAVRLHEAINTSDARQFFVDLGTWVRPIRDTIYVAPAFTIKPADLKSLCDAISRFVDT